MSFDRLSPYNDLPLLPPKENVETKKIFKKTISAARALSALKGSGRNIPNQSVLVHAISLQEAKLSSEIENIFTTNDDLYQAFSSAKKVVDPHTKEVLSYQDALWYGYHKLSNKPFLTTNLFIEIFKRIKKNDGSIRNLPGTKIGDASGGVVYTPPEGENLIREKLANLETYLNEDNGVDPLIKMAVAHYQFEAIHPFFDGNGRTGRILNVLYLVTQGLLELPILFLSKYIIENKPKYYNCLKDVTEKDAWEKWIIYVLTAVEEMAIYTQRKVDDIYESIQNTKRKVRKQLSKIYTRELIDVLYTLPYCKIASVEKAGIVKRQTAGEYLKKLSEIGVLEPFKVGKEVLYLNSEFYDILKR